MGRNKNFAIILLDLYKKYSSENIITYKDFNTSLIANKSKDKRIRFKYIKEWNELKFENITNLQFSDFLLNLYKNIIKG